MKAKNKTEGFQPVAHSGPDKGIKSIFIYYVRMLLGFQTNSVYQFMKRNLPSLTGIVLDVGCGNFPYRHLFKKRRTTYIGLDVAVADHFKYNATNILRSDGVHLSFENNSINYIICTEVLEHSASPDALCRKILRVLAAGGAAYIIVPWSARFHYIPYDYHRFTPTRIRELFAGASSVMITGRGTDIAVICNKIIVVFARALTSFGITYPLWLLCSIIMAPLLLIAIVLGLLSLVFKIGSPNDPLGYSIIVTVGA